MDWVTIFQSLITGLLLTSIIAIGKVLLSISRIDSSISAMDLKLNSHEKLDEERFGRIHTSLDVIHSDVREIRHRINVLSDNK